MEKERPKNKVLNKGQTELIENPLIQKSDN